MHPTPKRMSDEAVRKATGKTWPQWFAVLDKAGAKKMAHRNIAEWLYTKKKVPGWWCQMVTVTYEQARKGRKLHERPGGFEISVGRTLPLSMGKLYAAWMNAGRRQQWLQRTLRPKKTKQKRTLRFLWTDGSPLDVRFDNRPGSKCRAMVTHSRLKNAKQAASMKKWWAAAFARFEKSVSK